MIKIYSARDLTDAHLIKGLLESCGITAHVNGGFLSGGIGELPPLDLVTVSVEDGQFEEAQRVLEEYERGEMMGD